MFSKKFNRNNIFPLHFTLYAMTGFWKIETKSKWKKILYEIYHVFNEISFVFLMISACIDAYSVFDDLGKLSSNLCTTITCTGSVFKIWFLNSKKKEVERISIKLDNNLYLENVGNSQDDKEIMERNSRDLTLITVIFYAMGIPLIIFWIAFPMLDNPEDRRFPIPFIHFPKMKETPIYELIYSYHALSIILFFFNILSYDMIYYGFLVRICAQFEILGKNFKKINDLYPKIDFERIVDGYLEEKQEYWLDIHHSSENLTQIKINNNYSYDTSSKNELELKTKTTARWRCEETIKIIKHNIIHHKIILQTVEDIDKIYNGPVMVQLISGAGLIGVVAYGIVAGSGGFNLELMQKLFYAGCALFDLLFFCYFGSHMAELSNNVRSALYDSAWYEMDKKPRKLCLFVIARLQKPPMVTALKMFPITLKTYLQLLRVSYNMIALLRTARSH